MPNYITYDERYYGGYISGLAGSRDAPGNTATSYSLAPNDIGYEHMPSSYYQSDIDVYDLGLLNAGTYVLDVDGVNWDFSNSYYGTGISEFGVFDYSEIPNYGEYEYNELNDVEFTIATPTQMYAYVKGSSFLGSEYSIQYPNGRTRV